MDILLQKINKILHPTKKYCTLVLIQRLLINLGSTCKQRLPHEYSHNITAGYRQELFTKYSGYPFITSLCFSKFQNRLSWQKVFKSDMLLCKILNPNS